MQVMASIAGRLKYGGSWFTISITMMPSDQISTWIEEEEVGNGGGEVGSMIMTI